MIDPNKTILKFLIDLALYNFASEIELTKMRPKSVIAGCFYFSLFSSIDLFRKKIEFHLRIEDTVNVISRLNIYMGHALQSVILVS
jgi:hypothetical protein